MFSYETLFDQQRGYADDQCSANKKVLYGGDYNPKQWPKEIWEQDVIWEYVTTMIFTVNLSVIV